MFISVEKDLTPINTFKLNWCHRK